MTVSVTAVKFHRSFGYIISKIRDDSVMFKRLFLFFPLSIVVSLFFAEVTVRYIFGFPSLGVRDLYHVYPDDAYLNGTSYENLYYPYAKYFNVENGYVVHRLNNYGLPGTDIRAHSNKQIFLLGNSYIESRATPPNESTSGVLQKCLDEMDLSYSVVNLSKGGQIPDLGYYRLAFWERHVRPFKVILVLEDHMLGNIAAYRRGIRTVGGKGIRKVTNLKLLVATKAFTASTFLNCLRNGLKYSKIDQPSKAPERMMKETLSRDEAIRLLMIDLRSFRNKYGDRFMVYSLIEPNANHQLSVFCRDNAISFASNSAITADSRYLINGGHFNVNGNRLLGESLASFVQNEPR